MSDQYRPQPYDDGPRTTVDPHLLPQRPAQASSRPERADAPAQQTADAPVENVTEASDHAATAPEAPADSTEAEADRPGAFAVGSNGDTSREDREGFDAPSAAPTGDPRLDEAVARSRSIPVEDDPYAANDTTAHTGAGTTAAAAGVSTAAGAAATRDGEDTSTRAYDDDFDKTPWERAEDKNSEPLGMPAVAVKERTDEPDIYADVDNDPYADTKARPAAETQTLDEPVALPAHDPARAETSPTEGLIVEPDKRGNRGFAFFTALLATVVFGAVYAAAFAAARMIFTTGGDFVGGVMEFVATAPFYVPVVLFGIFLIVWSLIANRAGWWSYIIASLIAAVITGAGYYLGVGFQDVVNGQPWSNETVETAVRSAEHLPGALLAFIAGRESALWIGGIASARGRRVKKRNAEARAQYDRKVAEEREYEAQRTAVAVDEEG